MNRDAAALCDIAHHQIPRHRLAALRVAYHEPVHALDLDPAPEAEPLDHAAEGGRLGRLQVVGRKVRVQSAHHRPERDVTATQRGLQLLGGPDRQIGGRARQPGLVGRVEAPAAHLACQDLLSQIEALLVLFLTDPLPDLVAGAGSLHVRQPVPRRLGLRTGHDFHGVAVLERAMQGRDPAVDARALAVLADLRVYRKGEVNRRRALG